jgi:hypothetical protein
MKIQLDLPEEINHALKIEKAQQNLGSLQELIILILAQRYNLVEVRE